MFTLQKLTNRKYLEIHPNIADLIYVLHAFLNQTSGPSLYSSPSLAVLVGDLTGSKGLHLHAAMAGITDPRSCESDLILIV